MSRSSPSDVSLDSAALFRAYAGFVARFLTRLGVAPSDLDDLLQEVSMNAPVGTVYWRLHKARRALREALAAVGEGRTTAPLSKGVR